MSLNNQNEQPSFAGKNIAKGVGHSVGLKLLLVCFLVLLMGVPTLMISAISFERAGRADDVEREVSKSYGGPQILQGPVLHIPYGVQNKEGEIIAYREHVIFAETGAVEVDNFTTTIRELSLFKVPTYQADANFSARFVLPSKGDFEVRGQTFFWEDAKITIGLRDVRSLRDDVYLSTSTGEKLKFGPKGSVRSTTQRYRDITVYDKNTGKPTVNKYRRYSDHINMQSMEVHVGSLLSGRHKGRSAFSITASLQMSGSQMLSISPFAQTTKASVVTDWPHPGFFGDYPPQARKVTETGFSANWVVPYLARGMAAYGDAGALNLDQLTTKAMSVKFVNPVNPYQNVNRALKYAVLFIGMVFLAYFLFETLVGVKVHAAQYVLVGLAQSVFYLLLLAFAEQIGFSLAFVLAAGATVFITAAYAGVVFGKSYTAKAGAVFMATYGLLYVLMRIEDFALMVGALASFVAIAATMYLTRNVNWYGNNPEADIA